MLLKVTVDAGWPFPKYFITLVRSKIVVKTDKQQKLFLDLRACRANCLFIIAFELTTKKKLLLIIDYSYMVIWKYITMGHSPTSFCTVYPNWKEATFQLPILSMIGNEKNIGWRNGMIKKLQKRNSSSSERVKIRSKKWVDSFAWYKLTRESNNLVIN